MIRRFYTAGHKIERYTAGQDSYGTPTKTWALHLELDGKLWQLRGDERQASGKETLFADHKFACDTADITEKDRFIDPDGQAYDIRAVAQRKRPDGTGHLELLLELVR